MTEYNDIDLSMYKLVNPTSIKRKKQKRLMYDITTNNHTFMVKTPSAVILSHNCDGHHISSLLLNFFYKWFPHIIEEGRLFKLVTPLVVCDHKNSRKYFYSLEEFSTFTEKISNVNYLKGLGSLSIDDWNHVMTNKVLFQVVIDRSSGKFLDIAFGDSSAKRKKWLEGNDN